MAPRGPQAQERNPARNAKRGGPENHGACEQRDQARWSRGHLKAGRPPPHTKASGFAPTAAVNGEVGRAIRAAGLGTQEMGAPCATGRGFRPHRATATAIGHDFAADQAGGTGQDLQGEISRCCRPMANGKCAAEKNWGRAPAPRPPQLGAHGGWVEETGTSHPGRREQEDRPATRSAARHRQGRDHRFRRLWPTDRRALRQAAPPALRRSAARPNGPFIIEARCDGLQGDRHNLDGSISSMAHRPAHERASNSASPQTLPGPNGRRVRRDCRRWWSNRPARLVSTRSTRFVPGPAQKRKKENGRACPFAVRQDFSARRQQGKRETRLIGQRALGRPPSAKPSARLPAALEAQPGGKHPWIEAISRIISGPAKRAAGHRRRTIWTRLAERIRQAFRASDCWPGGNHRGPRLSAAPGG